MTAGWIFKRSYAALIPGNATGATADWCLRLEFAVFSVKTVPMTGHIQDHAAGQWPSRDAMRGPTRGSAGRLVRAAWIGLALTLAVLPRPAHAQLFGERPPPVPPGVVPNVPTGPAVSLAPPSGPAATPDFPSPLLQPVAPGMSGAPGPGAAAVPAVPAIPSGQGVLILSARYGKDQQAIANGLVWRIYADKPDSGGAFKLVREDRNPTPNLVLAPGGYVVHVSFGLASAVRPVTIKQDTVREIFDLPAGGLRIEGRVGTSKIPTGHITFDVFKGSQFEAAERAPAAQAVPAGDVVVLPEGIYYIISNYGDANSVVRSDIRVQVGKLTDVTVTHRAAAITLKLVSDRGGEALANTSWSVLTIGGDVIKESTGAFPRVVLAEGEYRAIARNEGKTFERSFKVTNGVDGEIEVVAR
jgi:hypothetical protein